MKKTPQIKCAIFLPNLIIDRRSEYNFYDKLLKSNYLKITGIYLIEKKKNKYNFFFSNLLIRFIKFIESRFISCNSITEQVALKKKFLKKGVRNLSFENINNSNFIDEISKNNLLLNFNNLKVPCVKKINPSYGIWSFSEIHANQNFLIQELLRFLNEKEIFELPLCVYKNKKNHIIRKFSFNRFNFFFQTQEFALTKTFNFALYEIKFIFEKRKFNTAIKVIKKRKELTGPFPLIIKYIFFKYIQVLYQKLIPTNLQLMNQKNYKWHLALFSGQITINNLKRAKVIFPPDDEFWADPFFFRNKEDEYIFFENYEYKKKKGCIAVGKLVNDNLKNIKNIIECKYHLSYPYIFEYKDNIYLIPETHEKKRLEIWKSIKFPYKWKLHKTILQGLKIADTSIIKYRGNYWVFANISNDEYNDFTSELHIYKANNPLLDKLIPHKNNPVLTSCKSARNGGQVYFDSQRNLIRPSQAYVKGIYGHHLNLSKVTKLNLSEYEEKIIKKINPTFKSNIIGVHHISHNKKKSVIDIMMRKNK